MEEQSLQAFTEKLLNEDVFHCNVCQQFLNVPITLVDNLGNVCPNCCAHNNLKGIHNEKFELLIGRLKLPCKFKKAGCQEQIFFKDLKVHEDTCKFHENACLMLHEGCEWEGVQSNFRTHFMECHSDHILESQNNLFLIDIEPTEKIHLTKLLKGKHEFILTISNDLNNENLIYKICDFKTNESSNNYCIIKHLGQSTIETKCVISHMNDIKATVVNLNAVKQITESSDTIKIQVKLSPENEVQELDEKILQCLECPVCKTVMKPPIYQCKFGHSFCSNCKPKLEKCPSCRALFGTTRNYSLEGLTAGLHYSCKYHNLGCEETFQAQNSEKHEAICPYKPYLCPIDECSFQGTHANIGKHLDEKHKDGVIASDFYKTTTEFYPLFDCYAYQEKFYMVFDENIFRLSFKRNTDYSFWAVEVLKKKDENSVFIYDIGVIDMRKPDRKLIRCDVCFSNVNNEDLFKKCILFPNNIIASYACNAVFTYYCQIRKRQ